MRQLSIPACALWAKKGKPGVMTWLPLYQHMADSAGVVRYLWNNWLPKGLQHLIESGLSAPDEAEQLLVFLAAAHDLGKASPVFQAKPRSYIPDDLDEQLMDALHAAGLPCDAYDSFLIKLKPGTR